MSDRSEAEEVSDLTLRLQGLEIVIRRAPPRGARGSRAPSPALSTAYSLVSAPAEGRDT